MKTELTEQKNKFIRKVKNILFTLGPLINLANIIIITINPTITNAVSPRRW